MRMLSLGFQNKFQNLNEKAITVIKNSISAYMQEANRCLMLGCDCFYDWHIKVISHST